jgi:hypothetical protein
VQRVNRIASRYSNLTDSRGSVVKDEAATKGGLILRLRQPSCNPLVLKQVWFMQVVCIHSKAGYQLL